MTRELVPRSQRSFYLLQRPELGRWPSVDMGIPLCCHPLRDSLDQRSHQLAGAWPVHSSNALVTTYELHLS